MTTAGVFAGATTHAFVEVPARALEAMKWSKIDGVVARGGGSTAGLALADPHRTPRPLDRKAIAATWAGERPAPGRL